MIPASSLYLKNDLADVTFVVPNSHKKGSCRIPAHTQLISARSDVFRAMFYGNFEKRSEVEIPDAESDDFKSFLKYFYYGCVELTNKNVFRVLYLAQKYLIDDLVKSCASYIDRITPDATNAIRLFVEAQRCGDIPRKLWRDLVTFATIAIESSEFLLFDRTNVREFLRSDKLRVTEGDIYARLKAWAEHQLRESDPEEPVTDARIRDYIGDDIWLVRYAQMTVEEFTNGVSRDDCLTVDENADVLLYLDCENSEIRGQIGQRLPLLNTSPRQRDPPRTHSWYEWPLLRTLFGHHVPSRKIPGLTIETLVAGDGRNFPLPGQRVRCTFVMKGVETEEKFGVLTWLDNGVETEEQFLLNGKEIFRGYELAILTMSIGEQARITMTPDLYCMDDGVCRAAKDSHYVWIVLTLLGIE